MSDKLSELLPCPFCGGAVVLEQTIDKRHWWGVKCRNTLNLGGTCAIEQIPSASPEAAVERWNRRASPAPAIPAVHWQPIETAPKDGSMILMWVHANRHLIDEDGNPYEENFATVDFGEWKEFGEHGGAFIAYSGPHGDGADGITHWMPLPVDPTDDALKAAPAISESEDARDAARYRLLRRGQRWSVINGIGDTLRAEELDAAIDAARKENQS
ncbi:Lar family restriction alleviation protein [Burkholderia glumae]|uniref:Lar family restriction alleviation protein n=1 Tax=Burkholderia glumae TaxID=337 RepID=UPI003B9968DE